MSRLRICTFALVLAACADGPPGDDPAADGTSAEGPVDLTAAATPVHQPAEQSLLRGDSAWSEAVAARVAAGQLAIHREGDALVASNPEQRFSVSWVGERTTLAGAQSPAILRSSPTDWSLELRSVSWGRSEHERPLRADARLGPCRDPSRRDPLDRCLPTVERRDGDLVERFDNAAVGLLQSWTLAAPPRGAGPVRIRVRFEGAAASVDPSTGAASEAAVEAAIHVAGGPTLSYRDLHAWDARGAALPVSLAADGSDVLIHVDDAGAAYPITVDPTLGGERWEVLGSQSEADLGWAMTGGDFNGDGLADAAVSARLQDVGTTDMGQVWIYPGTPDGLAHTASHTLTGGIIDIRFGSALAACDVNGDGYDDLAVGAPGWPISYPQEGAVLWYAGGPTGLDPDYSWSVAGGAQDALSGTSLACADRDLDGYDDLAVGEPGVPVGGAARGRVRFFAGSASGPSNSGVLTDVGAVDGDQFGLLVAAVGDLNGDGCAEFAAGSETMDNGELDEGVVRVYFGCDGDPGVADWTIDSDQASAYLGSGVDGGDVNGDGYDDLIIGLERWDGPYANSGAAWAFLGSTTSPGSTPDWTLDGEDRAGADWGHAISSGGDVDGDGYDDLLVGAPGWGNEGRGWLYRGSASGLASSPAWILDANQGGEQVGHALAILGDTNGDGFDDLMFGGLKLSLGRTDNGRLMVLYGSDGPPLSPGGGSLGGGQGDADFGASVAGAGDVNGDGYADVLVGAPGYDGGQVNEGAAFLFRGSASGLSPVAAWMVEGNDAGARLGASVAGAGDVDADGYDDVLVGVPDGNGALTGDQGIARLSAGSAAGLGSSPSWTGEGGADSVDFGSAVASAGDVNGDGYSDILVADDKDDEFHALGGHV